MNAETRNSIVAYIEQRAAQHLEKADATHGADVSYHKGTAVLFKALAGDIRAELDV